MSVPEIAEHLGLARNVINTCMTTARKNHPGKFFRILRYRPQIGVSGRETPIYSASPGPDAPRPVFDKAEGRRSHYQRNRARLAAERYRRRGTEATWLSGLMPLARRNYPPTART
ncbi:hypothetical protein [Alicycliphilus denitrificans]|uniref:hypothetical protein n=1 Tax=Alicycliphilus denitrificans TaxID=179636 RepID=UPI0002F8755F|nr:hypothetical protein [Alicycliphilus denitrificans]